MTGLPSLSLDPGWATCVLMALSMAAQWWVFTKAGIFEKGEAAAVNKDLAEANKRIADALEKLDDRSHAHELADEKRFTQLEEFRRSQDETNQRLAGIAENLSRQLTNVAMGLASETVAREVPATRGRS